MHHFGSYELAHFLVSLSLVNNEGFTVHSETLNPPLEGFTVGGVYTSYAGRDLFKFAVPKTEADRLLVVNKLADVIHGCGGPEQLCQEAFFFGGWGIETTAEELYVLDVTTVHATEDEARETARKRGQDSFGEVREYKYVNEYKTVREDI